MGSTLLSLASLFLALSASFLHQIAGAETEHLTSSKLNSPILQDSIAKQINENPKAGWEAAINPRFSNFTVNIQLSLHLPCYYPCSYYYDYIIINVVRISGKVAQFKRLLGVKKTSRKELTSTPVITHPKSLKFPKNFDARTAWSQCSTIGRILGYPLGHCGSCWAFGAVESLQDRFCIHYDVNITLSVNDLLACCGFLCGAGCNGGEPLHAWRYLSHHGVVTEECDPYFDQIGCAHPGCEPGYKTPKCVKKCVGGNLLWKKSKHYSVSAYRVKSDPSDIMAEVYKNGPVEVAFTVYEDFAHYKSGVYKHITGSALGGHAVKLIGWGTSDDGEDYWVS
ncbi:hypothetical protein RIF29_24667 [Crotalaria pallida]|uniref:Peptidase C1A papain C-terminal domain-containing protein n=1 Tax=Crotalaria pallida TaxID=3830 RepID=A0AAN9EKY7_CROPI